MVNFMNENNDYEICLSIQRALLDKVTSSLRSVGFEKDEKVISLFFVYDGKISDIDRENADDAAAEVISDFPNCNIDCKILELDYPQKKSILSEESYIADMNESKKMTYYAFWAILSDFIKLLN